MTVATAMDGRTALVTEASSGVGEATAKLLAKAGADVVLAARREQRLEEIAESIAQDCSGDALVVPTDLREATEIREMVNRTIGWNGGLDVLVNNAAVGHSTDVALEDLPIEEYYKLRDVNVDATVLATRVALPFLREAGGHLLFVGSIGGQYPHPTAPLYTASKYWLRGFAHALEARVGEDGVAVSVLNPSEVRTEWRHSEDDTAAREQYDPGNSLEPEDVAEAILFSVTREPPLTISRMDVYRRDKLGDFIG